MEIEDLLPDDLLKQREQNRSERRELNRIRRRIGKGVRQEQHALKSLRNEQEARARAPKLSNFRPFDDVTDVVTAFESLFR